MSFLLAERVHADAFKIRRGRKGIPPRLCRILFLQDVYDKARQGYSAGSGPPSQSFTVRSHDELASFIPSGESARPRTAAEWVVSVLKQRPFERSQKRMV